MSPNAGEYEIFEWNMGHVANYAELSMLMTPRPFMVERGHDDGVGLDEWVAYARQLHDQSDLPAGGFETQYYSVKNCRPSNSEPFRLGLPAPTKRS